MKHFNLLQFLIRLFGPQPADDGSARMMLLVLSIMLAAALLVALIGVEPLVMILLTLLMLASLLLVLRGNLLLAGLVPSVFGFALYAYMIVGNYGLRDPSILGLAVIMIAASLITGRRGSLVFGALGALVVLAVWWAESHGWVAGHATPVNNLSDYLVTILALGLVAVLQYTVLGRLDHTLERAQKELAEREAAAQALRESEARYRLLVNEAPLGILILGAEGHIEQANPAALELLDYPLEALLGVHPRYLVDPADYYSGRPDLVLLRTGKPYQAEHRLRRKKGDSLTVMGSMKQMPDGHFQYIFQDISARKQAEAAIQSLNENLEKRVHERTVQLQTVNRELESFAYTVSHDLRAPLRAINGYASLLAEELQAMPDGEAHVFLSNIRFSARRMDMLISSLLQFSRLSHASLDLAPVDCRTLIQSLLLDLAPSERSIQWRILDPPACLADPSLLRQVYANLISNAVKYTSLCPEALIELGGCENEAENLYYVKDNGIGFEMQYAGKVFGAFERLHPPDEFEGAGLGLAIVQRIVEHHGGRVWCEAQPGQGATFYFTLPKNGAGALND